MSVAALSGETAADKQIRQMIEFIMSEAREKEEEIRQKTNADYNSKLQECDRILSYVTSLSFLHLFPLLSLHIR